MKNDPLLLVKQQEKANETQLEKVKHELAENLKNLKIDQEKEIAQLVGTLDEEKNKLKQEYDTQLNNVKYELEQKHQQALSQLASISESTCSDLAKKLVNKIFN